MFYKDILQKFSQNKQQNLGLSITVCNLNTETKSTVSKDQPFLSLTKSFMFLSEARNYLPVKKGRKCYM